MKETAEEKKRKPGRPKGPTRLDKQLDEMNLAEKLENLPKDCNVGTKKNSKVYKVSWTGCKLHIDAADGGILISCILTSVSTHDCQAVIPLGEITSWRVTSCNNLMDAAYDSPQIHEHSKNLCHVPIIKINPQRNNALIEELAAESKRCKNVGHKTAEVVRYRAKHG